VEIAQDNDFWQFGESQGQNYHGERYGHGLRRAIEVEACLVDLAEADRNAAVNSELKAEEFQHTLFLVTSPHYHTSKPLHIVSQPTRFVRSAFCGGGFLWFFGGYHDAALRSARILKHISR
jgi:hypothetical protein